jgi:hypothetical protein
VGVDPVASTTVHPGQTASLERLDNAGAVAGHVLRTDSLLNPKTRQIDVDVGMPAGVLITGEAVRAQIRVGDLQGWLVPHRAVVATNADAHVFQMFQGKAVAVAVTVGQAGGTNDLVQGPLVANRPIIVDGAYQVSDGGDVRLAGR